MIEKEGVGKIRYVHYACACPTGRGACYRSLFFLAGSSLPPAVHTMAMFSAGGGSLSLLLEADGFGFT